MFKWRPWYVNFVKKILTIFEKKLWFVIFIFLDKNASLIKISRKLRHLLF